ncbi:MAG TPA: DNA polymerase III subunit gamma/tau [Rudaea sp.]|nr:DNA polymerase III subunit gamma/tau [Rudaea sp.]
MSYQVLARKWRPKRFAELVGQEHVVRALSNALDSDRMHHAFLFTGTRGVGKTTMARIFAKSLNCERGQSSTPCGECGACRDIDAGRFVDLLEIDAASNTGIDDVREVIENAQYTPARGRFKVYLIDEVHMLSKNAFNALLKTLEEPPPHVKFLLATTDPQKLPVTVLSRCLKFNLKRLLPEQIGGQMKHILAAEGVAFDGDALAEIARAADGSLRDGLSLLDQAIAYGAGSVRAVDVRAMLGTIERGRVFALLGAIDAGDGAALLAEIGNLAEFSPDFSAVLDEIAGVLHRVQLKQLIRGYDSVEAVDDAGIGALAAALTSEATQLYYQIAVTGRRDLPLAPTPRAGFEMTMLRMLAFRPVVAGEAKAPGTTATTPVGAVPARARAAPVAPATPAAARPTGAAPATAIGEPPIDAAGSASGASPAAVDLNDWTSLIDAAGLKGTVGQLARHSSLVAIEAGVVRLSLKPMHEHFNLPAVAATLEQKLSALLGRPLKVRFEKTTAAHEVPAEAAQRERSERQLAAEESLAGDPGVQSLLREFGGRLVGESIRPEANGKTVEK